MDLTILAGGGYDELLQRTHAVADASDGQEIRGLLAAQSKLVTIQRIRILPHRDGADATEIPAGPALGQVLAALKPGDIVDYAINIHHPQLLPQGQQSLHYELRRHQIFGEGRVNVHVPKGSTIKVSASGFEQQTIQTTAAGRTYSYVVRNDTALPEEDNVANREATMPTVRVSTFKNYTALAALIEGEFAKAVVHSDVLGQIAERIAARADNPRAAARATYQWVQQHIAYDAQAMDANGITPRSLPAILASGHGDCKDHVVLFQALLKAQGIESIMVLINTESQYQLSTTPVVADFNHVITYLPAFDLYVDATDKYARFDRLPLNRQDKPVLWLDRDGKQARTPLTADDSSVTDAAYRLDQGSMVVSSRTVSEGESALETILVRDAMQGQDLGALLEKSLVARGLRAPRGTMRFDGDVDRMNFTMNFSSQLASADHRVAIAFNPFFGKRSTLGGMSLGFQAARRANGFLCPPRTIVERYTLVMPTGSKATMPDAVDIQAAELAYQSSYTQQGNRVTISRRFTSTSKKAACDAGDYIRYQRFARRVADDIATQIRYSWP